MKIRNQILKVGIMISLEGFSLWAHSINLQKIEFLSCSENQKTCIRIESEKSNFNQEMTLENFKNPKVTFYQNQKIIKTLDGFNAVWLRESNSLLIYYKQNNSILSEYYNLENQTMAQAK